MFRLALVLHVLAVVLWVGGMAFAHFALRPALAETLEPPQRLSLLAAILRRFFAAVTSAIVLIILSGVFLWGHVAAGPSVHAMAAIGGVMVALFAYMRLRPYPAMRLAVQSGRWPDAASAAAVIRHIVAVNLTLGAVVIAVAVWGR